MDARTLEDRLATLEREGRRWRRVALGLLAAGVVVVPVALVASDVPSLTTFADGTVASASSVNGNFAALRTAVNDNDARLDERQVSFLARASGGGGIAPVQTRVPFDAEIFDDGGNYNPTTAEFTAPVSGKYVFAWRVDFGNATGNNNYRRVGLKVNGSDYANVESALGAFLNVANNSYLHFSDTIVVSLTAGQKVSIATTDGYTGFNGSLYGPPSYFTGWRLY